MRTSCTHVGTTHTPQCSCKQRTFCHSARAIFLVACSLCFNPAKKVTPARSSCLTKGSSTCPSTKMEVLRPLQVHSHCILAPRFLLAWWVFAVAHSWRRATNSPSTSQELVVMHLLRIAHSTLFLLLAKLFKHCKQWSHVALTRLTPPLLRSPPFKPAPHTTSSPKQLQFKEHCVQ